MRSAVAEKKGIFNLPEEVFTYPNRPWDIRRLTSTGHDHVYDNYREILNRPSDPDLAWIPQEHAAHVDEGEDSRKRKHRQFLPTNCSLQTILGEQKYHCKLWPRPLSPTTQRNNTCCACMLKEAPASKKLSPVTAPAYTPSLGRKRNFGLTQRRKLAITPKIRESTRRFRSSLPD